MSSFNDSGGEDGGDICNIFDFDEDDDVVGRMEAAATPMEATNDNGNMTAAATPTEAMNDGGDTTTAVATPMEATNDDGDTMAAATMTEATNEDSNMTAAATTMEAMNNNGNTTAAATPMEATITEDDNDDDDDGDTAATTTEEMPAPISIDQPESAATEVKEACEQLLLDAANHVKMAREQRALYQAQFIHTSVAD